MIWKIGLFIIGVGLGFWLIRKIWKQSTSEESHKVTVTPIREEYTKKIQTIREESKRKSLDEVAQDLIKPMVFIVAIFLSSCTLFKTTKNEKREVTKKETKLIIMPSPPQVPESEFKQTTIKGKKALYLWEWEARQYSSFMKKNKVYREEWVEFTKKISNAISDFLEGKK